MSVIITPIRNLFRNLLTLKNKTYKSISRNLDIIINIENINLGKDIIANNLKMKIILKDFITEKKRSSYIFEILKNIFNKFFIIEIETIEIEFCLWNKNNFIFKLEIERLSYGNNIILIEGCKLYSFNKDINNSLNKQYKEISNSFNCVIELFNSLNIYTNDIKIKGSIFDIIKILNYILLFNDSISNEESSKSKILIQIPNLEIIFKENILLKINKIILNFELPNKLIENELNPNIFSCSNLILKINDLNFLITDLYLKLNYLLIFFNNKIKKDILNYIFNKDEIFKNKIKNSIKFKTLKCSNKEIYIIGNSLNLNIYLTNEFIIELIELIIIISNLISGITFNEFEFDDLKSYLSSKTKNSLKERLNKLKIEDMSTEFNNSIENEEITSEAQLGLFFCIIYILYLLNNSKELKIKREEKIINFSNIFNNAIITKETSLNNLIYLKTETTSIAIFKLFFIELNYSENKGIIKLEINNKKLLRNILLKLIYSIKRYSTLNCYETEYEKINRYLKKPIKNTITFLNKNNIEILNNELFKLNFNGDLMKINFINEDNNYNILWNIKKKDRNSILGTINSSINFNILKNILKIFNKEFINNLINILETTIPLKKNFILFINYRNYEDYSRRVIRIRNSCIFNLELKLKEFIFPFKININLIELYENIKDFLIINIIYESNNINIINNKIIGFKIDYILFKQFPILYKFYEKINKYFNPTIETNNNSLNINIEEIKKQYNKLKDNLFTNENILDEFSIREMTSNEIIKYLKKKELIKNFNKIIMNLNIKLKDNEIEILEWVSINIKLKDKIEIKGGCAISLYKLFKIINIIKKITEKKEEEEINNNFSYEFLINLLNINFKFVLLGETIYRFNINYIDSLIISIEENFNTFNYFYCILKPIEFNKEDLITIIDFLISKENTQIELNIKNIELNIKSEIKSKIVEYFNYKLNKPIKFNYTPNLIINNEIINKYGFESSEKLKIYKLNERILEIRNSIEKIELNLIKDILIINNTIYELILNYNSMNKIIKKGLNTFKQINQFEICNQLIKVTEIKKEMNILISFYNKNNKKYLKMNIKKETNYLLININPCISIKNEIFTGCIPMDSIIKKYNNILIKGGCLVCGFKNECNKYLKLLINNEIINIKYLDKLDLYDNYSYYLNADNEYPPVFKLIPKIDKTEKIGLFLNENNRIKINNFSIKQEDESNLYIFSYKTLIATNIFSEISMCINNHLQHINKPQIIINKQILKDSYMSYISVNTLNEEEESDYNIFNIKINDGKKHKLKLKTTKTYFLKINKDVYMEVKPIFINNNVIIILKLTCQCERILHFEKYLIKNTKDYLKYLNSKDNKFFNCKKLNLFISKININLFNFQYNKFYEDKIHEKYFYNNINLNKVDLCPIPYFSEDVINDLYININNDVITSGCNQNYIINNNNIFEYLFNNKPNKELTFQNILNTENIFIEESYKIQVNDSLIKLYGILGNKDRSLILDYKSFQIDNPIMNGVLIKADSGFVCIQFINKYITNNNNDDDDISSNECLKKKINSKLIFNDVILSPKSLIVYLGALNTNSGEIPNIENINLILLTPIKIIAKLALATIPIHIKDINETELTNKEIKLIFPSIQLINSNLLIINKYLNKCLVNSIGNNILKNIPGIGAGAIGKVFGKVGKGFLFNIKSLINRNKKEINTITSFGIDFILSNENEEKNIIEKKIFINKYLQIYYDFYRNYQKLINSLFNKLKFDYSLIKLEKQNRFINKLINDKDEEGRRRIDYPIFNLSIYCNPKHLYSCLIECEIEYSQINYFIKNNINNKSNQTLFQLIKNIKEKPNKIIISEKTINIIKFYLIINNMILSSDVSIIYKQKRRESYLILCKYFIYIYCFGIIKFKDLQIIGGELIVKGKFILIVNKNCYNNLLIFLEGLKENDLFL